MDAQAQDPQAGAQQQQGGRPLLPADDGRVVPLSVYPRTRLTTLIATRLGLAFYRDLPAPGYESYPFLFSPLCYLLAFDSEGISAKDVRHLAREGKHLRGFRSACRQHLGGEQPALEVHLVALADRWLAFAGNPAAVEADPSLLDHCVDECYAIHVAMTRTLKELHVRKHGMPAAAAEIFLLSDSISDLRLPTHLRGAAQAAEKVEVQRRSRRGGAPADDDDGGGRARKKPRGDGDGARRPVVPPDSFWCQACRGLFPKAQGADHRTSASHVANAKKRR